MKKKIEGTTVELKKKILKLQILIRKIKFGGKYKEKNVKKTKETKKDIARIFTKINNS